MTVKGDGDVPERVIAEYRTMQQIAADYLRSAILSGRFAQGVAISPDQVAAELEVSRMPVREALRVLSSEGLVELRPHRRAVVVSLAEADIAEIFGLRALLEAKAVELSVPELEEETLARIRNLYAEMLAAADRADMEGWLGFNRRFHHATHSRCPWSRLQGMIQAQVNPLAPYFKLWSSSLASPTLGEHIGEFNVHHDGIVRAIEARDAAGAAYATSEHILATSRALREFVRHRRDGAAQLP